MKNENLKTDRQLLHTDKRTIAALTVVIAAACLVIFSQYIFGRRILAFYDIGSDTMQLYLSQYGAIIRKIRTGDLTLWDPNNGFGINMNMLNMTNPALILLYLFGAVFGTEAFPYAIVYLYILEILAAGLAAYFFLSLFPLSELPKACAAFLYAFNGFLIVWGQHYQFAVVPALLMLELFFTERAIRSRRRWPALTVMTCILVLNSMYIAYMSLLFCGFYVVVRFLTRPLKSFKAYVLDVIRLAVPMGLGVGLGFITLLPAVAAILSVSSRLSSDMSLFERLTTIRYPRLYYVTLFRRFFSSTACGITYYQGFLNYYEAPCLYFSGIFPFLAADYLTSIPAQKRPLHVKIVEALLAAVVFLAVCLPATGTIMNGLTAPFSRYMFIVMPYFTLVSAYALERIMVRRRVSEAGLVISLPILIVVYGRLMRDNYYGNSKTLAAIHLVITLLAGVVLAACCFKMAGRIGKLLPLALTALILCDVTADSAANFTSRDAVTKGGSYFTDMYDEDTREALSYLSETETAYVRTEKTYGATLALDALIQGYHPVSTYNSTQNANIQNFVREFWPEIEYADINHYVYVLGCSRDDMASLVGIKYVLSPSEEAGIPSMQKMKTFGDVTVYVNPEVETIASFYPLNAVSGSFGIASDGFTPTVTVSFDKRDREAAVMMKETGKSDRITGEVQAGEDGVLFIAVPFEHGWSVYVDGEEAVMRKANEGFIAVDLTAGSHAVEMRYLCPGLVKGAAISLLSVLIFIVFLVLDRRYWRHHADDHAL